MAETFHTLKDKIGEHFFITHVNGTKECSRMLPDRPYKLLRQTNDYLTFYKKVGDTEYRFDFREQDIPSHKFEQAWQK